MLKQGAPGERSRYQVGVAFVVREKFGWALPALERLYSHMDVPFRLYFLDCGYPPTVLAPIRKFLSDKGNVVWMKSPRFLWPNESVNEIIPHLAEPYLCIVQNDVLIEPGFMSAQLQTFEAEAADLVWPMTFEMADGVIEPHRDEYTETHIHERNGLLRVQQPPETPPAKPLPPVRRIQHFELHSLSMTARAAELLFPFPVINTREHVDLALHAYRRDLRVFVNEAAQATYVLPPIRQYDVEYFRFRWNPAAANDSVRTVARRWAVTRLPAAGDWIRTHLLFADPSKVLSGEVHFETDPQVPCPEA